MAGAVCDAMIFTIGHSTLSAVVFAAILQGADIETVVDVRSFPGSRRVPHFGRESMQQWLPELSIGYEWEPRLGGRRRSKYRVKCGWTHPSFAAYAGHMLSADFGAGISALIERYGPPESSRCALMCSEAVWWRCHRGMISDHLTAAGIGVTHLPSGTVHADVIGDRLERYHVQPELEVAA